MNVARHFFAEAVVLFSLFLLFAAKTGNTAERSVEKVRIAVSSKSLGFLDTWAAKERGFYRKQGLDAEIIAMRPPLTIGAIQAGEIDYAFGAKHDFARQHLGRTGQARHVGAENFFSYFGGAPADQVARRPERKNHRRHDRRRR